jgi:hypothetical protein
MITVLFSYQETPRRVYGHIKAIQRQQSQDEKTHGQHQKRPARAKLARRFLIYQTAPGPCLFPLFPCKILDFWIF